MSLRTKLSKSLNKKFIQHFQKTLPISSKTPDPSLSQYQVFDENKLRLKDFLTTVDNDTTPVGQRFQAEFKRLQSLSFVNEIANTPVKKLDKSQYYNRAEEVNKKFAIQRVEGTKTSKRVGLLGYKMGMTVAWDKWGTAFPLTVVKVDNCQVTQVKTKATEKYEALQVGMGDIKPEKTTKAMVGHFIKNNISPKRFVREFKVSGENTLPTGYMLTARHFIPGQYIDVKAVSKGHGWQGVMKRWNFKGLVATHGCSVKHRAAGSIGNREFPGKVWKGKKMAGQLGNERTTVLNQLVFRTDYKRNLLFIKGSLPGNINGIILIRDAIKKEDQWKILPYPTFIEEKGKAYSNIMEWDGSVDLNEVYQHDNDEVLGISEEEEEGEPDKNAEEDTMAKK